MPRAASDSMSRRCPLSRRGATRTSSRAAPSAVASSAPPSPRAPSAYASRERWWSSPSSWRSAVAQEPEPPRTKPLLATNSEVWAADQARCHCCWATADSARWIASRAASTSTQADAGSSSRRVPAAARHGTTRRTRDTRAFSAASCRSASSGHSSAVTASRVVSWSRRTTRRAKKSAPCGPGSTCSRRTPSSSTASRPQTWIRAAIGVMMRSWSRSGPPSHSPRFCQGTAKARGPPSTRPREGPDMTRLIRCECGFIARGESDDDVVAAIEAHMSTRPSRRPGPPRP